MNEEERQAMKQILTGTIETPYMKGFKDIQKRIRKHRKKGEEVPEELEEEFNIQLDKLCNWRL